MIAVTPSTQRTQAPTFTRGTFSWLLAGRVPEAIALVLYAALALVVVLHHEGWRDEADAWLYARDGDLATIATWTRYAGTPALWYLLLIPLARSGLPYVSELLLHAGIAVAAVAVFLRYAPFPRLTRFLFVFSYFMAYEYAAVARSYGLSVLLLFCIAALYRHRFSRPITYALPVFLLSNSNVHSLGVAGGLCAAYAWELWRGTRRTPRNVLAAGLMAAGGALALLQLRPPSDGNIEGAFRMFAPGNAAYSISAAFLPMFGTQALLPLPLFALVVVFAWLRKTPPALFVLAGAYAWLGYIYVFKYSPSPRHSGLLLIDVLFALWIGAVSRPEGLRDAPGAGPARGLRREPLRLALVVLNACLGVSVAAAAVYWSLDVRYPYSGAAEMATYIRGHHLTTSVIAAHQAGYAEALLPYLDGEQFWYAGIEQFGTYMRWDGAMRRGDALPLEEAVRRAETSFAGRDDVLFLANLPLDDAQARGYELLYATTGAAFAHPDERYFLYRWQNP